MNLLKRKWMISTIASVIICTAFINLPTTKATEQPYTTSTSEVYVDGKKVNYPVLPILKYGTTLVPFRETFEAMGATVEWDPKEFAVFANKGNTKLKLIIDSTTAQINGETRSLIAPPILYKGKTMIPLRFVGEAFVGDVQYDPNSKNINITMPKYAIEFLAKEQGKLTNVTNVQNVIMSGNRRLLVSDNPEILSPTTLSGDNVTLSNDIVMVNQSTMDHRVFGWHINQFDEEVTVGITIENVSNDTSFKVDSLKGINKITSTGFYDLDVGLPISEALLDDRLSQIKLINEPIMPGQSLTLDSFQLKPNELVGFLYDLTVTKESGKGELNYVIRTVISKDGSDLTTIKSSPIDLDHKNPHPRGVWPSSELIATLPYYYVNEGTELSYTISNGETDNLFNSANSLVTPSISNKGHFGTVYKVKIPYINHFYEQKTIRVRIGSRGGIYSGTVKTTEGIFNIPPLDPMKDVVNVIDYQTTNNEGIIELDIVHAGGSSLPIVINLTTLE